MRTIAVAGAKGGVGKTTLAVHLAVAAVQQGRDVVLVDADPQLSAVRWSERRSSSEPVVLGRAVSQLAAEMERIAGFGADVAIVRHAAACMGRRRQRRPRRGQARRRRTGAV